VGVAALAGIALLAIDVRLDGTAIARLDVRDAVADRHDLDAEFVAGDARVAEERHLAEVAVKVGPADADAEDTDHGVAGTGGRWFGDVDHTEGFRFFKLDGAHGSVLSVWDAVHAMAGREVRVAAATGGGQTVEK